MRQTRKQAKDYIKTATRQQYDYIVHAAFLTNRQEKILLLKKTDAELDNWQIGNMLNLSVDTVNHELLKIYDKISKVLLI